MTDFPRSLIEFQQRFPDEAACVDYLAAGRTALSAGGQPSKPTAWPVMPVPPAFVMIPHVVGKMAAHVVLPWVHRFFSNLKVWVLGVYHGLRRQHVQSYLDEFVFGFNRRRARHAAFRSLLGIAAAHAPLSDKMLIAPEAAE